MIPIYRFIKDTDPHLEVSEPYVLNFDGVRIMYMKAIYNLRCDPSKDNDVHKYLASDPYGETTNIIGFLKFEDEPIRNRGDVLNPQDYFRWSKIFRIKSAVEKRNRVPFITSYEFRGDTAKVAGDVIFNHVNCPDSGSGTDDIHVYRGDESETIRGKLATCDNSMYPANGCPIVPVSANLGLLMPSPNRKEVNFIGNANIKGIVVIAISPKGKPYQYLSSSKMIRDEHYVSDLMKYLNDYPEHFQDLINSSAKYYPVHQLV